MRDLDLNFAAPFRQFNIVAMVLLASVLSIFSGFLLYQHQQLRHSIQAKNEAMSMGSVAKPVAMENPALEHSMALAHDAQYALNLPWQPMFAALELAQLANPEIHLLSIRPNPSKPEIIIIGETSNFDALLQYMNDLRAQPVLGEAVLVNQRSNTLDQGASRLGFTISVGWKL